MHCINKEEKWHIMSMNFPSKFQNMSDDAWKEVKLSVTILEKSTEITNYKRELRLHFRLS